MWSGEIRVGNGKRVYLGYSDDPKDIARKYNELAKEHFGGYARLNPI